ncbi:MAG: GNAT family N-acetyltransferase [Methylococcaceae bacterium]|nr:GNAT family N-acetyltransferase [Methylococcaceae bacterium]
MVSGPALEIRRIDPGLEGALADFFASLDQAGDYAVFHPHPFTPQQATAIARSDGLDLYYAATAAGEVLGYGMLRGWDEGYAVPSLGLAVAPRHRGRGLGRLMMAFLHEAARLRGASRVRLTVYAHNASAVALYRRLGYRFSDAGEGQLLGLLELGPRGER